MRGKLRATGGVALTLAAWLLLVGWPAMASPHSGLELSDWTCAPEGRSCTFDSDCCSKNCVSDPNLGKICKPKDASWTCAPEGRSCTFDSDCCSKNCVSDPNLGKVCKPKDASWTCVPPCCAETGLRRSPPPCTMTRL